MSGRARGRASDPTMSIDPTMEDELRMVEGADPSGGVGDDRDLERHMLEMLDNMDNLLPDIPPLPGYHNCWLSTTNERDYIGQRERWGYTPYLMSELPAGAHVPTDVQTAGVGDGLIRVREMVLYKVPIARAEAIMRINHHLRPNQMAEALDPRRQIRLQEARDRSGRPLIGPADGFDAQSEFTANMAAPVFIKQ